MSIDDLITVCRNISEVITDEEHRKRIQHCDENGAIIILKEGSKIIGYAEIYTLDKVPDWPVEPWPVSQKGGQYLYCWYTFVDQEYRKSKALTEMIQIARASFNCKWLCYHRDKYNHRLKVVRL